MKRAMFESFLERTIDTGAAHKCGGLFLVRSAGIEPAASVDRVSQRCSSA